MYTDFQQAMISNMLKRVSKGIVRDAIQLPSEWAQSYRIMDSKTGKAPWRFDRHPWLKDMHDSKATNNIGQKSAQMGYTETVLNLTLYHVDVGRLSVLYALPSLHPDASEFSTSRFDAAIELSEHLQSVFSGVCNVGMKRSGAASVFIRGSRSKSGFKSLPVGLLVLDELDEMDQENVALSFSRTSGQEDRLHWLISTPTRKSYGISAHFENSTQNHYFFKCPSCSRFIELRWPDSMVITAEDPNSDDILRTHLICTECKAVLPHEGKQAMYKTAQWQPLQPGRLDVGWYINQLYSCSFPPYEIARVFLKGLTDISVEQQFWNSNMGLPHQPDGAQVKDEEILTAMKSGYSKEEARKRTKGPKVTMGVDVGKRIHVEITAWDIPSHYVDPDDINAHAFANVIADIVVTDFHELDKLMRNYHVDFCVIDAQPERRESVRFARRHPGRVRCCFYVQNINSKIVHISDATHEPTVSVDRTSWLDMSLGRFHNQTVKLPCDVSYEYREHIKSPARIPRAPNKMGDVYYDYLPSGADHFAHARNYSEIALLVLAGGGSYGNMGDLS